MPYQRKEEEEGPLGVVPGVVPQSMGVVLRASVDAHPWHPTLRGPLPFFSLVI